MNTEIEKSIEALNDSFDNTIAEWEKAEYKNIQYKHAIGGFLKRLGASQEYVNEYIEELDRLALISMKE